MNDEILKKLGNLDFYGKAPRFKDDKATVAMLGSALDIKNTFDAIDDDSVLKRSLAYKGYQDKLYQHKSNKKAIVKPEVKQAERDLLGDALDAAEYNRNNKYKVSGIDIDNRTGDFISDVVGRLLN